MPSHSRTTSGAALVALGAWVALEPALAPLAEPVHPVPVEGALYASGASNRRTDD